ncbi:unnamed protein product [Moneuplotes crassus]|uniref:Hexose transporter 1 n=1 Tax=Euplotes crassus TaxID=5936 RepID=A0AAD1XBP4_EUPCR|nr:unnamed protein product [Moneuplotes crassus]
MGTDKPNILYLVTCSLTAATGFLISGYSFGYYNGLTGILHKQYVNYDKDRISDSDLFNSVVSGMLPFGAIFGSLAAGEITKRGRRITFMITSVILVVGTVLTLIFNMYALIFGRFIMGFAIGIYFSVCPLYISEISPPSMSGILGSLNQMNFVSGLFFSFALIYILPLPDDPEAKTTRLWRITCGIPIIFGIIQFCLFFFVFRYDTPVFYKLKGNMTNYGKITSLLTSNDKVQNDPENNVELSETKRKINSGSDKDHKDDSEEKENNIYQDHQSEENDGGDEESKEQQQESPKASAKEVNDSQNNLKDQKTQSEKNESEKNDSVDAKPVKREWTPHYKKAFIICCLLSFFHQATGVNAITFFSTEIFKDGDEGNTAEKRARLGTLLLGVSALIGTAIAVFLFKIFSRKFFFHASGFVILGSHFLSGIFSLIDFDIGIIIMTMAYIMVFNGGMGPAMWIYSSDVLDNFGTSVVALINMVFTCLFATFANLMFEHLTAPGMYFGLAFVQVLCSLFIWKFVRETKGKTKEECEKLYCDE